MKRIISIALSLFMILNVVSSDQTLLRVCAAEDTNYLSNPGFENDIWGTDPGWTVSVPGDDWKELEVKTQGAPENSAQIRTGDMSLHYYAPNANKFEVSQTVSLTAGTYTFSGYFSGALSSAELYSSVSDTTSAVTLSGWAVWDNGQLVFTITEEQDVTIGFRIIAQDKGWGDVDDMRLVAGDSGEEPEEPVTGESKTVTIDPVENLSSDFAMGVDVSSVISEEEAGVQFKNTDGEVEDFFKILSDAGVNYIRVRVWNDPYDENGNSYGGGNCNLVNAIKIAERAAGYNMKMLICFHYSDFWASPAEQEVPKSWKGKTVEERAELISSFTTDALTKLKESGADIGMVQIGNETSVSFCGSDQYDWDSICTMLAAGCNAVKAFDPDIKTIIHFGGSSTGKYVDYAECLAENNVPYDVLGISWYPFYNHGTLQQLTDNMDKIVTKYGKQVIVAENSYPYCFDDTDGHSNEFGDARYVTYENQMNWDVSPQGQAEQVRDVIEALSTVQDGNGIGYFYWEPGWITVGDTTGLTDENAYNAQVDKNRDLWLQYGCGWASSYAVSYYSKYSNVREYWGGSSWDNQAMFDASGKALDSLNVFKYVRTGSTGNENKLVSFEQPTVTLNISDQLTEADIWSAIWWKQINCTYEDGTSGWTNVSRWFGGKNSDCSRIVSAYKVRAAGTFTIHGIMADDENSVVKMTVKIIGDSSCIESCTLSRSSFTYTGKAKTPSVTLITTRKTLLKKGTDYTVTYPESRTNIGTYTVTIKSKEGSCYNFTKKLTFKILPKGTSISNLTAGKKEFTIKYKKQAVKTTGYQVSYSTSSKFVKSKTKTKKYSVKKSVKHKISSLKSKTTYYVRVRTYKVSGGKTYYSGWSKVKKIKTK